MPANGTTNSAHGIHDRKASLYRDCLRATRDHGKAHLIHAEVPVLNGQVVPKSLRSKLFVPVIQDIRDEFSDLKMCIEHIDIKELVELVVEGGEYMSATVTPHHMEVTVEQADHDAHLQCMPYPKGPEDIEAILEVVIKGHPRFFYGSDNAPHLLPAKLMDPPASGVFTAPTELPAVLELFERKRELARIEPFMSEFFAKWHGLPLNEGNIMLERKPWVVPEVIDLGDGNTIVPYKHGERLKWRIVG